MPEPVRKEKATYDPAVIEAWSHSLRTYRRRGGRFYAPLMVVALVCFGIALVTHGVVASFACIFGFVAGFVIDLYARAGIRCPHCGEDPAAPQHRVNPTALEWCERCYYWLRRPY